MNKIGPKLTIRPFKALEGDFCENMFISITDTDVFSLSEANTFKCLHNFQIKYIKQYILHVIESSVTNFSR